jgi:RNA polymerase sigma factor (sigma-70 family)
MSEIQTLVAEYVNNGSEAAFRELVERYLDLVYSTAVRLVSGDTHLAEDVTQTVFVDLAHLAKNLSGEVRLGGWLHRHTCFTAGKILRGERRRRARERQATEMNAQPDHSEAHLAQVAPILDEAINQLGSTDRAAVLLRFYERLDFRLIGEALGTSEAAAQKRVSRALDKLHILLRQRGVTLTVMALGTALADEAVTAAPSGLAAIIPGAALSSVASGAGSISTFVTFMATTKIKAGLITGVILASVLTPLFVELRSQTEFRAQDLAFQRRAIELAQALADNQHLTSLVAQPTNSQPMAGNELRRMLRLRNEVGLLRKTVQEMKSGKAAPALSAEDQLASMKKMYSEQVDRLKQWLEAHPSEKIPELQNINDQTWTDAAGSLESDNDFERAARMLRANAQNPVVSKLWTALRNYTKSNNGQFPTDLAELKPYFSSPIDDSVLQRYEILPASKMVSELQPGGDWVITQRNTPNPELDMRSAIGVDHLLEVDERVTNRWTLAQ